jgi:hypothetical protein
MVARLLDAALHLNQSTFLIHDVDAIDIFSDLNAITPETEAATRIINTTNREHALQATAPVLRLESTGAAGAHSVTVEAVVFGVDMRGITFASQVRFNNVSVDTTGPVVSRASIGVVPMYLQGWAVQAKSGAIQAGDALMLGYDLGGDTVFLCDTTNQATQPRFFGTNAMVTAMTPVPAGNLTPLKRHTRWVTGKPTAAASFAVLMVPPPDTIL